MLSPSHRETAGRSPKPSVQYLWPLPALGCLFPLLITTEEPSQCYWLKLTWLFSEVCYWAHVLHLIALTFWRGGSHYTGIESTPIIIKEQQNEELGFLACHRASLSAAESALLNLIVKSMAHTAEKSISYDTLLQESGRIQKPLGKNDFSGQQRRLGPSLKLIGTSKGFFTFSFLKLKW